MTTTIRALLALLFVLTPSLASAQTAAQVQQILSSFNNEPTILEVQKEAARYARVNPGVYSTWASAASWAHLLPERVKGYIERLDREERDVREFGVEDTANATINQLLADDLWVRMRAEVQWDFSKIIFNPDTLKVSKEISNVVELREEILTTVNKLYFARRELQVQLKLNPPDDVQRAIRQQLRIDGLTADLDALTGGWFSAQIGRRTAQLEQSKGVSDAAIAAGAERKAATPTPTP